MMETTRLSSKGQVILPKAVREAQHWPVGTEFTVETTAEGVLLRPIKTFQASSLDQLAGCLASDAPAKTLDEMQAAIATHIRARRDSGRY